VLHLPDTLKCAGQPLYGAKLLLLLLLLLLLWLCAFRHRDLQLTLASCLNYLIITSPIVQQQTSSVPLVLKASIESRMDKSPTEGELCTPTPNA
jgi:hypothetical protein